MAAWDDGMLFYAALPPWSPSSLPLFGLLNFPFQVVQWNNGIGIKFAEPSRTKLLSDGHGQTNPSMQARNLQLQFLPPNYLTREPRIAFNPNTSQNDSNQTHQMMPSHVRERREPYVLKGRKLIITPRLSDESPWGRLKTEQHDDMAATAGSPTSSNAYNSSSPKQNGS